MEQAVAATRWIRSSRASRPSWRHSPAWPLIWTTVSSLPVGTGWSAVTTIEEPNSTLNGVLNVLIIAIRSARPVLVNLIDRALVVTSPARIGAIVPIALAWGSLGLSAEVGATYTV